jgi:hypothetical protein
MAQGVTDPSRAAVMDQFRKNVIAANHEKVHENRSINEMWKLRQEHASRMSAARATAAGIQQALQPPSPLGVDTALATQSALDHSAYRSKFINDEMKKNADYNPSRRRFGKMLKSDQEIGREYMKAMATKNDPSATQEEKQAAELYISRARNKKDANFVAWRKGYDNIVNKAENAWDKEYTLSGRTGNRGKAAIEDIYNYGKDIYSKLHEVPQASPLAAQLAQHLDYNVDKDGNNYSYMNKNKVLDIVALTKLLGGKFDTSKSSVINKVMKAIKGKKYFEDSNNLNRTFGSGTYDNRTINTARETVIFKDKDLFDDLTSDEKKVLEKIGITKNNNNEWRVPITTTINQGFSWAYEDVMTDKDVGGASYAGNNWVDKQASQWNGIQKWY